jgi:predicted transcriptional regulator
VVAQPIPIAVRCRMTSEIPSAAEVRSRLMSLTPTQVEELAEKTGVPLPTLIKIRHDQTKNPRIETVRALWPALVEMTSAEAA